MGVATEQRCVRVRVRHWKQNRWTAEATSVRKDEQPWRD